MTIENDIFSVDLAGVIVGETSISDVQGEAGILSYRDIAITELVDKPFQEVVWLVLFGKWPSARQSTQLQEYLIDNSALDDSELALLRGLPTALHPMLMLQGMVPLLKLPEQPSLGLPLDAEQGLHIAAKVFPGDPSHPCCVRWPKTRGNGCGATMCALACLIPPAAACEPARASATGRRRLD